MLRKGAGVVVLLALCGCVGTTYVPQVRHDYATALVKRGVWVHVLEPRIKGISLRPPFECDARTLALAERGFALDGVEPDTLERFSDYEPVYAEGVWAIQTVHGPELEPGPWLYVETGTEAEHPGLSVLNVVNRYNEVAKCVARAEAGS